MRLSVAARYFDKTLCADAFALGTTFFGQLDVFDDSKRDGATVVRRVLSVAPTVVLPARRVLTIGAEQWLVGQNEDDSFAGAVLRRKYILQRADGVASIRTFGQAIAGAGGTDTYGAKLWVKDMKEIEVSSKLSGFFNIYLPSPETVAAGSVISLGGRLHVVRNTFKSSGGFLVTEGDELDAAAVLAGTYHGVTGYAPATDVVTAGATAVTLLRIRYQDDYEYANEAEPKFVVGDIKAYVRKSQIATARAKDKVDLSALSWLVESVSDENDCWGLHLRRAP
jgi:hypothetical protein